MKQKEFEMKWNMIPEKVKVLKMVEGHRLDTSPEPQPFLYASQYAVVGNGGLIEIHNHEHSGNCLPVTFKVEWVIDIAGFKDDN